MTRMNTNHPVETRLLQARRQLRKAGRDLDKAAALPEYTRRTLQTIAEDCAIQTATVLKKLELVRSLVDDGVATDDTKDTNERN